MEHIAQHRHQLLEAARGLTDLPADAVEGLPASVRAMVDLLRNSTPTLLTALDDHARMEFIIDPEMPVDVHLPDEVVAACVAENPDMPMRSIIDRARLYVTTPEYLTKQALAIAEAAAA